MVETTFGAREILPRCGSGGARDVLMANVFLLFGLSIIASLRVVYSDIKECGMAVELGVRCI